MSTIIRNQNAQLFFYDDFYCKNENDNTQIMTNQMTSLSPNLMVKDVNKTVAFYTEILGFTTIATVPQSGNLDWAMVKNGSITFMFQEEQNIKTEYPELAASEPGGALTFYISVTNLQQLFDDLANKVKIIKQIHQTFYGANEFSVADNNGFILTFSQSAA